MGWIVLAIAMVLVGTWILQKVLQNRKARKRREIEFERIALAGLSPEPFPIAANVEPSASEPSASEPPEETLTDDTRLRSLLQEGKYEAADRETLSLMLRAVGAEQRGYFEIEDFETLPPDVLLRLDRLWLEFSDGRFGFSTQRRLYYAVEGEYSKLGTRVGWTTGGQWFEGDGMPQLADAPEGHLPAAPWQVILVSFGFMGLAMCLDVLFERDDWEDNPEPATSTATSTATSDMGDRPVSPT